LKGRQTHPHPENRSNAPCPWNNEIRKARPMFALEALLDLSDQSLGIDSNAREDFTCSLVLATENKKAWRLRDSQGTNQKRGGWDGFHPEHPAPRRRAKPKGRASSAGNPG